MEARTVYDLILVAIVLLIAIRGWRQGMLSEVLRLAGWVVAAVLVTQYARNWAEKIYQVVLEPNTIAKVAEVMPANASAIMSSGVAALQTIQNILNSLSGLLGGHVIDQQTANAILNIAGQDNATLARAIADTVLRPVLVSAVQMVLGGFILFGCLFAARFLARLTVSRRRKNSILSMTNRLLGLALGIGEGLVSAYVYVFVLSLLVLFINTSWLNQDILHSTYLVRLFL